MIILQVNRAIIPTRLKIILQISREIVWAKGELLATHKTTRARKEEGHPNINDLSINLEYYSKSHPY